MSSKPSKYDTNPLDSDFPEKAKAAAEGLDTQTLPYNGAETQAFPYVAPTAEQQTRKFAEPDVQAYSSQYSATYGTPFNGQSLPANYKAVSFSDVNTSGSRKVAKVGLPENVMTALPYVPWYLGLVASVLMLVFVPKSEAKVRFHAAQGLAAHIAILIVSTILGVLSQVVSFASFGNGIFNLVTMILLIIFAFKAWKGRPVHIESIEELTNWLDEKISPRS
jgi:uncharacterized membrane protein